MSGALDVKARQVAENLLKKFGKVAQYRQESVGSYDPLTGDTTETVNLFDITCYIDKPTTGEINAGLASVEDAMILVSSKELGIDVEIGDDIVFTDITYEIKLDLPVYSGEQIALHRLVCARR